jgi:Holliday junction resolvase-like predicted endonuclease
VSKLENLKGDIRTLDSYEPDNLDIIPLLFQTGYISIKDKVKDEIFILSYPNYEVKKSFLRYLLKYIGDKEKDTIFIETLRNALKDGNTESFMELLKSFLSSIPYDIGDRIKEREQHYQTIIYVLLSLLGVDVNGEVRTNKGRIDLSIEFDNAIYIIEIKMRGTVDDAIKQIDEKGYIDMYKKSRKIINKLAIIFDVRERNITEWKLIKV